MLQLNIQIENDFEMVSSKVKVIFSTDYFSTKDSTELDFNKSTDSYTGNIGLNNFKGKVQYYIVAQTSNNQTSVLPKNAPSEKFSFRVGPDYYPPELKHNSTKIVSKCNPSVEILALANDNLGIQSVKVEFKIDGIEQEPEVMQKNKLELYGCSLQLPNSI